MGKLTFTECFAQYSAKLVNPMWAVSAQAADGAIVISCWSDYFTKPDKNTLRYTDSLSRWKANAPGNNLLREHLLMAQSKNLLIRLVIASTTEGGYVDSGKDASLIPKTFHVRPDLVGQVVKFTGDEFVIDFRRV